MSDQASRDRLIAKLQHFSELLQSIQAEKENLLLSMDRESCEKEKLKIQIYLCQQLEKEYYEIFKDILYR